VEINILRYIIIMSSGGKRKINKSLKAWVAFVKKVQKEEKLDYKQAIHRAKVRKDKGEKWMTGGEPNACQKEEEDLQRCKNPRMDVEEGSSEEEPSSSSSLNRNLADEFARADTTHGNGEIEGGRRKSRRRGSRRRGGRKTCRRGGYRHPRSRRHHRR
jgi:hypothetical protein